MSQRLRLSIVSYLNSLPFLHGLRNSELSDEIEISEDHPALCAEKLKSGAADIGLIPVAALPSIENVSVISDYCIGCDGEVDSVLLVAQEPLERLDSVLLDYQSRTSVQLVQLLAFHHWKKKLEYKPAFEGYEATIQGTTGGVIIGDRALMIRGKFKYVYDLGKAWKAYTGLPFVFAVWASTVPLDVRFIEKFNQALKAGVAAIPELAQRTSLEFLNSIEIRNYWENRIDYSYKEPQQKAMETFLGLLRSSKT